MTPRLFVRKAARVDVSEAFRWYEERSVGLGHEFLRSMRVALRAVEQAPLQFPIAIDDIRRVRLRRFPYMIYFVVLAKQISVIAITHGRRNSQH